MIRFFHTADLHLDSPFKGITDMPADRLAQLRESTFAAFDKLIEAAEKARPDFVLMVGDIYDGEDRSLRAQMRFVKGLERLQQAGVPVVLSHGNHDHLAGKWTRFKLPENVTVFGPEVETAELSVRGQLVRIHGFSYKDRHIKESMIDQFPKAHDEQEIIDIGMLHGSIAGDVTHDVYAPFTVESLLEKRYQYWALGHIHKRQILHRDPPVVYPGNLQGRHRNESGVKGFYEVELDAGHVSLEFVPASVLVFDEIELDCTGMVHANEWLRACQQQAEAFAERVGPCMLRVRNVQIHAETAQLFDGASAEEWLEVLRQSSSPDVWFSDLVFEPVKTNSTASDSPLVRSVKEQMDAWEADDWKEVLEDVYQHARSAPYLTELDEQTKERLKEDAGKLISNELLS